MPIAALCVPDGMLLEFEATGDGRELLDWTQLVYTAGVNHARSLTLQLASRDALQKCRLGSKLHIEVGRGNQIGTLAFRGIIKIIQPGTDSSVITAFDYTTHLAKSNIKEYKEQDVVGHALYFLAAAECDYEDIDVSQLVQGSGIFATSDMALTGLLTRKAFIDKCFENMYETFNDVNHDKLAVVPWRYAIRQDGRMDFFLPDFKHYQAAPALTVTDGDDVLTGSGIVAQVDSTKVVNSATFYNSADATMYETYTNNHSQELYGPHSILVGYNSANRDVLFRLAQEYVEQRVMPTVSYTVQMNSGEWLSLGDLVRVRVPQLKRDDLLPVVRLQTSIGESITTNITLGEPELTLSEHIKLLA